jgi:NCAIR mutase (PurE)-related protein
MDKQEVLGILKNIQAGSVSPEEALLKLRMEPFSDLGYAKPDHHRGLRRGVAEVIYGAGKTPGQISGIVSSMRGKGQRLVLITRISGDTADIIGKDIPLKYYDIAKIAIVGSIPEPDGVGKVVIATGGTSDMPVAEEAAVTAEALGNEVVRLYDVGVAGLHRLTSKLDVIMGARVIVAVAGMEGALASVVGGLADCPVIGVPTSVGYGVSFGGISALLTMLNSCASGVSVVNIDNGFGAGYLASVINHLR